MQSDQEERKGALSGATYRIVGFCNIIFSFSQNQKVLNVLKLLTFGIRVVLVRSAILVYSRFSRWTSYKMR